METWANEWGTILVAGIGIIGMIAVQLIASMRDWANQRLQLEHQNGTELRSRRFQAYGDLIEAAHVLSMIIPESLTRESTSADLNAEERTPFNRATAKAELLASKPVRIAIGGVADAVYGYGDNQSNSSWKAIETSIDTFVDAAQGEADRGNILGLLKPKKIKS